MDVYNGDQGYIESIDPRFARLVVRYPPRAKRRRNASSRKPGRYGSDSDDDEYVSSDGFHRVTYQGAEIADMLQLAWATTVHKVGSMELRGNW